MKKLLIYCWLPCLLAMFMCTTFTACSDDDDNDGGPGKGGNIIGKWDYVYDEDADSEEILEFKENGEMVTSRKGSSSERVQYYETNDGILYQYLYGKDNLACSICKYYTKGNNLYIAYIGTRDTDGATHYYSEWDEEFEPDYEVWKRIE